MCEPEVFDFLPEEADSVMFEREPLQQIAATGNMHAYKHHVLEPMDMLKDNQDLEKCGRPIRLLGKCGKISQFHLFFVIILMIDIFNEFYQGKRVLVTGHTGFKGSWLSIWLHELGAKVTGISLDPYSERDNLYFRASEIRLQPISVLIFAMANE